MGSFTDLSVGGYPLLQTKSEAVPEVMTVFQEADRRVFTERNERVSGDADSEDDGETEVGIVYSL